VTGPQDVSHTVSPTLERVLAVAGEFARLARFEAANPEVNVVSPPMTFGSWLAILPAAGMIPGDPAATTIDAPHLEELMDQLEEIYPDEPDREGGRT
jgi:hypothetical protein